MTTSRSRTEHAGKLGVDIGDTITLRMGDNTPLDVRVVALFSAPDDYDTLLAPRRHPGRAHHRGTRDANPGQSRRNTDPEQLVADLTEDDLRRAA